MERKTLAAPVVANATVAGATGHVRAVFATLDVVDHDGDILTKGAIPDNAPVVISGFNHEAWQAGAWPIGKGTVRVQGNQAILNGQLFLNTDAGAEAYELLAQLGDLAEWSFGFNIVDPDRDAKGHRIIRQVDLFEVSPVLKGAGVGTRTMALKATQEPVDDPATIIDNVLAELQRLAELLAEPAPEPTE